MTSRMKFSGAICLSFVLSLFTTLASADTKFIQVAAQDKTERSAIANIGMTIEAVRSDSVWGFATDEERKTLRARGFRILGEFTEETARGGHEGAFGFPIEDNAYHTYSETVALLRDLEDHHTDVAKLQSIGKTAEGRDIWAMHLNSSTESLATGKSEKPGAIFMGNHHAREHLSVEVPLLLLKHLLDHRSEEPIRTLLETRDIWIIPMVNPDGAEYDVSTGKYKYWRKNRRNNGDGTFGVDLNRNYGFKWGTGGSSSSTSSETYMGKEPFSEPETQAIRDFVRSQKNATILLTFHSFSELVLFPWGHTNDPIAKKRDADVFRKMAETMGNMNGYTPLQSSDLYVASGDTTDWAYGELGIFAFTFELSPGGGGFNGFYPGPAMIQRAFEANLQPALYLMQVAQDPYRVLDSGQAGLLKHYVEPALP